ncbi:MAG TPA: NAD-dependent epimerase/dehydratase family protein [Terriglobia bacterium]|nr:NAD-dependent epimerase/dehydratase family protein [Terriglobia bacterium]
MIFWSTRRVLVTGGGGFLGSYVVQKLRERGCSHIFVPRSEEFGLREKDAVIQVLEQACPHIVFHLAAAVGGIGANRKFIR